MATPHNRNPKFDWDNQDIHKLKLEYYEIWLWEFMRKYKTWRGSVYLRLWYIPDSLKNKGGNKSKKQLEIYENTTKVARMYEKKMAEHESPKYNWPWSQFIKTCT